MKENVGAHGIRTLSERESEIVGKAAEGYSDKQICAALSISQGTLGTYWARIRQKCGLRWRTEIVAVWVRDQMRQESVEGPAEVSLESVLNSISVLLSVMDGRGVVSYGNAAFFESLSELEVAEGGSLTTDDVVRFEDGTSLVDRLKSLPESRAVARIGRGDRSGRRYLMRVWPVRGQADQFVALWEPVASRAAIEV
ncbi:MAG: helix-turn-helix transcriptional regulator [Fimbriimonadaceae bacterium]|nr:helix-turn-helix transcriptional regulator [Fimbriimonadaceae bacterium]